MTWQQVTVFKCQKPGSRSLSEHQPRVRPASSSRFKHIWTQQNFIARYELEDEGHSSRVSPRSSKTLSDSSDDDTAYADEPLADAEWLERYQEEMKANEELERSLKILSFFCLDRSRVVRLLVPAHEQSGRR